MRHALRDHFCEIRIIIERLLRFRAEVRHGQAALFQMFFERFLDLKPAVIRADGHSHTHAGRLPNGRLMMFDDA